ncbi:hypothetical protein Q0M94_11990 [Deinococcus radiomollis]|uniref:hypothetical protein n=1 Tax=Deinococcus radiomollis TaxID=468916 RepID=UPI0038925B18
MTLTLTSEARPMPRHRLPNKLFTQPDRVARSVTAREYAEAWYQAMREPETYTTDRIPSSGSRFGHLRLDEGHWRSGGGQTYVATPAGYRDERAIGKAVFTMLESSRADDVLYGKLLGRVITGVSMATLLDPRGGWASPRESAIRYALACLTLAVQVDDQTAEEALRQVRLMLLE